MPNHVKQRLTITGSANDVAAFVATARGAAPLSGDREGHNAHSELRLEPLCFHMIAPLPDSYSENGYSDHGYNLEHRGWSVKWGPYESADPVVSSDGRSAVYDFTCAWGPPVEALRRASARYRTLRFWLSWGGEGPCRGRHAFADGKVTLAIEDDYKTDIEPECATEEEYEADEDAAHAKSDAAEKKYIASHDAWVASA